MQFGASPRATINLTLAAKAWAFLQGRDHVTPQDIKDIAPDVLRHRLILTYEADAEGVDADAIVRRVLDAVRGLVELNSQFHDRILAASGSPTVSRLLETLRMPVAYRLYTWRDAGRPVSCRHSWAGAPCPRTARSACTASGRRPCGPSR